MLCIIAIVIGIAIIVDIMVLILTVITTLTKGWIGNFDFSNLLEIIRTYLEVMILYTAITSILMLVAVLVKKQWNYYRYKWALFIFIPTFLDLSYGQYDCFDKLYDLTIFYNTSLATAIKLNSTDIIEAVSVGLTTLLLSGLLGMTIFKNQNIK